MSGEYFAHYSFEGSYEQVGQQHGEALREEIQQHLELIYTLAWKESGVQKSQALERAAMFAPYIEKYAPGYMEEIAGLSRGAGITAAEALLLQVRQEVVNLKRYGASAPECTSYAISREYTENGKVYSGQNADLEGDIQEFSAVVTFAVTGRPKIIMVIPAGQLSYQGMNQEGVSTNCNFLSGNRWGLGFPRYLISRYLLEERSFKDACRKLEGLRERAASRNILLCDREGNMRDYETIATDWAQIESVDFLVHANHFVHPAMLKYETSREDELKDSELREQRLSRLIRGNRGSIGPEMIKAFLADHENGENSLCVHVSQEDQYHTFAGIINHLEDGCFEVVKGNPCSGLFKKYRI